MDPFQGHYSPQGLEIHDRMGLDLAIRSIPCAGADIASSIHSPMDHGTIARAGLDPPSRCIFHSFSTATACTGGMILRILHHRHPGPQGFIGQVLFKWYLQD
jgi:hypothetical protein